MLEVLLWLQLIYFLIAVAILVRKISFPDRWGHSKHFTLCSIYRSNQLLWEIHGIAFQLFYNGRIKSSESPPQNHAVPGLFF